MNKVSVVSCENYTKEQAREALSALLSPINGLDFVKSGMTVAIKVNLVAPIRPENAATTHPALVCALCEMLIERGAQVIVGDSPGGLYNAAYLGKVYKITQMTEVEKVGAKLNDDFSQSTAEYPKAHVAKSFLYTSYLDKADAIIDFCKLKSHGMMSLSCAVKNMFGAVPGLIKPEYHYRYPDTMDFASVMIDLNEYFKPALYIVDAVDAMEGNGPTQGKPRHIGALLASKDPYRLDMICAKLIGLNSYLVPTIAASQKYGLAPASADEIEIVGDLDSFIVSDFDRIENAGGTRFFADTPGVLGKFSRSFTQKALMSVPNVCKSECVGCKKCFDICPAKAITMKDRIPSIDRKKCIHCFCCQEFCPKGAMKVKRTLIARLVNKK